MPPVSSTVDHTYQVRFRLTRQDLLLLPGSIGFVAAGIFMSVEGRLWLGGLTAAFFGFYPLWRMIQLASRRVALRVDADGVTLGVSPPRSVKHTAFIPWSDVIRILLWRQAAGTTTIRYIGVERPEGCPPLPGSARSPLLKKLIPAFVPAHVPAQVAYDSRQVNGWRLHPDRLAAAVSHFAPHVEIVDLG